MGGERLSGLFITLEGPEGAGKTTQIHRLANYLTENNIPYLSLREPGGTKIGQKVREILLDSSLQEMAVITELLLYSASRAQLVAEKIAPALSQGYVVICDRYIDSTMVYQGFAGELSLSIVEGINRIATQQIMPNRTYLLDLPWETGEERLRSRGKSKDRIEQKAKTFHEQVRKGYQKLAEQNKERILVIDACQTEEDVFQRIWEDMEKLLVTYGFKTVTP